MRFRSRLDAVPFDHKGLAEGLRWSSPSGKVVWFRSRSPRVESFLRSVLEL